MARLIVDSEAEDIWTLQAGIFVASISLHTTAGFRVVGTRSRLGCMNRAWRDVVLLERRSVTPARNALTPTPRPCYVQFLSNLSAICPDHDSFL